MLGRLARILIALVLAMGPGGLAAAPKPAPGYDYYEIGDLRSARPGPTESALLLVGGGGWDQDAFRWFVGKAGHGHLVILAASGDAEHGEEFYREIGGLESVQTFVFHARRASFDKQLLVTLRKADGIFIAGGDPSNYVRYWKGTPVARVLDAHVAKGKPIGGTSAGLAILGSAGYGAMDGGSIHSKTALKDPMGPAVTMVRDFLHMPYLDHVVTDTHFAARNRLGRLIAFVAQVRSTSDPKAVGLGIDEGSALCVESRGRARFFTSKNGLAWLVQPVGSPRVKRGKPLDYPQVRITRFGPDGSIDLKTLHVTNPKDSVIATVRSGELRGAPR